MKVLNRPMFRYGGPIKEGIMSGIKEPRQRYQDAGQVFKNVQASLQPGQVADPKVLNAAAQLGIGNPYKDYNYKTSSIFPKVIVPRYAPNLSETDQLAAEVENYGTATGPLTDLQRAKLAVTFKGTEEARENLRRLQAEEEAKKNKDTSIFTTEDDMKEKVATGQVKPDVKLPGDTDPPVEKTRKEKVNSILESLGYDRAQKNALYDAMIKAGQRISRTGLGADNLVSDVIAETSQSYDKPEKLREAANLMQTQQDLKLEQIEASKTGGTLKQNYDFYISQGDSPEVAEKKARNLPTTITEKFNASKASTDSGKVYNVTMELTEEGFFGEGKEYKGKIPKKYDKDGGFEEFITSDDFKEDGVYNFKGEAILIEDGIAKKRQIIQPKTDTESFFKKITG
jgi:hypothetical protein